jgi:hypothetical protein
MPTWYAMRIIEDNPTIVEAARKNTAWEAFEEIKGTDDGFVTVRLRDYDEADVVDQTITWFRQERRKCRPEPQNLPFG